MGVHGSFSGGDELPTGDAAVVASSAVAGAVVEDPQEEEDDYDDPLG